MKWDIQKAYYRLYYEYNGAWVFEAAFVELCDAEYWINFNTGQTPPEQQFSYMIKFKSSIIWRSDQPTTA